MRKELLLAAASLLAAVTPLPAADPWREASHRRRVPLDFPAVPETVRVGVVLTGADFHRLTGFPRPAVGTLRMSGADGAVCLQVEETDGTGAVLASGANGLLDDTDRVVFAADLGPKPVRLFLYYDGPAAAQPAPSWKALEVVAQPGKLIPLTVKSGDLEVGVRGGGGPDPDVNRIENHGRGSFPVFVWKGARFASFTRAWGDFFPRAFGSQLGAPAWSEPAVVLAGPVRTVVALGCAGFAEKKDGKDVLTADIRRQIFFWNGMPVVDWEERVSYTAEGFERTWPYAGAGGYGAALDENDRLVVTLAGAPYALDLTETREQIAANPYRTFYSTEVPEEGWFAFQDKKEKSGLAVLYEKMGTIDFRNAWVTYRPGLHPVLSMRTTPYASVDVTIAFRDRALRCRPVMSREMRYVCLTDEAPETLRRVYRAWSDPIDAFAAAGRPEENPALR